jgi:hypothetical protein
VAIASNTVYVASYHANGGHYSIDNNYFTINGVDNPPLHALTDGVSGGNGVYAYGASSVFPDQSWNAANYWVDVIFQVDLLLLPKLAITSFDNGSYLIWFDGVPGKTYRIEYADTMVNPVWQDLGSSNADVSGRIEYIEHLPQSSCRYYRSTSLINSGDKSN